MKLIYPGLSRWIEKLPKHFGTVLLNILIVFMLIDMAISALALSRYTERHTAEADMMMSSEASSLDKFLDSHFNDERIERIYPNAKLVP